MKNSGRSPSFLFLRTASVVLCASAAVRGAQQAKVPDPSMMLALVPAAAQAGAPPCIKPGTRLTFFGMAASIPGEYKMLVQDENGKWVDSKTGKRYGAIDIPSSSGAGYNVVEVGHVGGGIVQLSTRLYVLNPSANKYMLTMTGGLVAHAGCAADYWIHPQVLKQVREINTQGVRIVRMPYSVGGKLYKAIRFQSENASGYNARVYDLETGLLIYYGSRTQGKPVMTPPVGGSGSPGLGKGSTQLTTGWIAEVKNIDVPWKNKADPPWIGTFRQLSYRGVLTTAVAVAGTSMNRPSVMTITLKARGPHWVRFGSHLVIQSIAGMPPQQSTQEGACGPATVTGLWISPQALVNLRPGQVIETHNLVGTSIAVSRTGPGFVTITETGPLHRLDCTYDTRTGTLSGLMLGQQIGLGTTTHTLRLVGRR